MKDQYGNDVPDDLVLLPHHILDGPDSTQKSRDIDIVLNARWYEIDGVLLASSKEINGISEDDPSDAGLNITENSQAFCIDGPLKRYSGEQFYHA